MKFHQEALPEKQFDALRQAAPALTRMGFYLAGGTALASLDDLACMKLSAIAQRGSRKDFYDIYALCQSHRPLAELLSLYRQKFAIDDIGPLLYGLVYFADAEAEPDPVLVRAVRWNAVKKAMRAWVSAIAGSSPG